MAAMEPAEQVYHCRTHNWSCFISGDYEQTIYLGEPEFLEIGNISRGVVYEIRMVDFNYDSDEPPTLPFRFQVM